MIILVNYVLNIYFSNVSEIENLSTASSSVKLELGSVTVAMVLPTIDALHLNRKLFMVLTA